MADDLPIYVDRSIEGLKRAGSDIGGVLSDARQNFINGRDQNPDPTDPFNGIRNVIKGLVDPASDLSDALGGSGAPLRRPKVEIDDRQYFGNNPTPLDGAAYLGGISPSEWQPGQEINPLAAALANGRPLAPPFGFGTISNTGGE